MKEQAQRLYAELGVRPVINAAGNLTMLGGSTPSPRVQEAMRLAGRYFVDMDELLRSSGARIAELLGCEAALVTPGCAAALVLGAAACMTGADAEKMGRLPEAKGMKDEILMQKAQRYKYDRVIRLAGTRIVEAGDESGTTAEQLGAAIGPQTLALLYPAHDERPGLVPVREAIGIARAGGVPIIVDAASRVYPPEGLKQYAAWGADLVGYGAKYFGAPNSTGLLCGRKDLVETARLHSFASFEKNELPGIGRPLKIDRQEVAAVVAALREWLEMDHGARLAACQRRARNLRRGLAGLPGVEPDESADSGWGATLILRLDEQVLGKTAAELAAELIAGTPSIWSRTQQNTLVFSMHTVLEGDEETIAARVREVIGED